MRKIGQGHSKPGQVPLRRAAQHGRMNTPAALRLARVYFEKWAKVAVFGAVLSCAAPCCAAAETPDRAPVGLMSLRLQDPARRNWEDTAPRPLQTTLWYPAAAGTPQQPWRVAIFDAGSNAPGAPLAATPPRWPLVLLSHGTGGSAVAMAWLGQALAAQGYLVAAVNHHGNTAAENTLRPEGFMVWWQRAQDLRVVLGGLLADPLFGPRIDAARVGVAGFSIGGQTALALVGARVDPARYSAACATQAPTAACSPPPEARTTSAALRALVEGSPRLQAELARMDENFADSRVKAAFAMAPALAGLFSDASLAAVQVPVQMVTGSNDDQVAPASTRAAAAAMPQASAQILPGVTHHAFITTCTAEGQRLGLPICVNPPRLDRLALHRQVAAQAVAFFNRTLPPPP